MRVVIAMALSVATAAVLCFLIGILPIWLHGPMQASDGPGESLALGFYFLGGLALGVFAAIWVFIFAFAYLSPSFAKEQKSN
jgi:hypothetical protein